MRFNTRALGIAAASVTAAVYTICALFVALYPGATSAFFGYLFHVDLSNIARPLSWLSYFAGVIGLSLFVGFVVGLVGWLYNALGQGKLVRAGSVRPFEQRA